VCVARRLAFGAAAWVCVMVLSGGLVAGTRAGFAYNTFPLMHGRWVPPEIMLLAPWWKNFFWNLATVQFDHRAIAWLLAISIPFTWWRVRSSQAPRRAQRGADLLLIALVLQISLGIATLVNVVPVPLASMHQAGALVVFTLALNLAHALR
jgi:cytochrome c oxidase assembly protein subunit 15